tara:strand:- start:368 stop:478 length:111 start_codon:yes stop_codon:yes gene_type:complete
MTLGDEAAARNTRSDQRTPTPAQQPATPAKEAEKKD